MDIVDIFKEYFGLIVGILSAVGILLLVSFSLGNIRSRRYDIGVLRALGCKSRSIATMFFVHGILLGIFAAMLSVLGIVFLTGVTNTMLIAGFKKYVKSPIIGLIEGIDIYCRNIVWYYYGRYCHGIRTYSDIGYYTDYRYQ